MILRKFWNSVCFLFVFCFLFFKWEVFRANMWYKSKNRNSPYLLPYNFLCHCRENFVWDPKVRVFLAISYLIGSKANVLLNHSCSCTSLINSFVSLKEQRFSPKRDWKKNQQLLKKKEKRQHRDTHSYIYSCLNLTGA